jgi:hypothetical protein
VLGDGRRAIVNRYMMWRLGLVALAGAAVAAVLFAPWFMMMVIWILPLAVAVYFGSAVLMLLREIRDEVRALRRERDERSHPPERAVE